MINFTIIRRTLTVSTAEKLFGETEAKSPRVIGKLTEIGGETYALATVIEDVPTNSHFDFNIAIRRSRIDYWGSRIYVQTKANVKPQDAENQLNDAYANFNPDLAADELYKSHFWQPISNINLNSDILYELKAPDNKSTSR